MRDLHVMKTLILSIALFFSTLHADNPKQTVTKELLSKTLSNGITTLDWVVRYESNSSTPLEAVAITDDFSSAQTYVATTEAHPNGWSVTQNPNQFVWEKGNSMEYSHDFPNSGLGGKTDSNGDGYAPIPYTALNGQKRFYYLNHHENKNYPLFGCMGECDMSFSSPIRLPDGDISSSETSGTSNAPETVIVGTNLYYPVTRSGDAGVGCYDLENNAECGYLPLSTLSTSQAVSAIDGLIKNGNNLYVMDGNGVAYRISISGNGSMTNTGSYDFSTVGMTTLSYPGAGGNYFGIGSDTTGSHVYFVKGSTNPTDRKIVCLETSSMMGCSAWGGAKTVPSVHLSGSNSFLYFTTNMVATEICVSPGVQNGNAQACLSLADGSVVSKADIFPSLTSIQYTTGFESTVGTKTYFPSGSRDPVFCHDWTGAGCTNNTIFRNNSADTISSNNTKNYGSAVDDDGCVWLYGHENYLWSINAETATSPCNRKKLVIEDTYDASKNWCASDSAEWKYTQFQINGLHPNDFTDLNVTFYDANGVVIHTASIPTNATSYSQGLFAAPFTTGEPIHYKIQGTRNASSDGTHTPPVITIGIDGPPREFCFQTTVPCPVTGDITNHVEVKLKGEQGADSSADVVEDAAALCEEVLPEPKYCLNAKPELKCTPTGWTVELGGFSPSSYNAANTEMTVLSPNGATLTKWGNIWHVNGVNAGDTIQMSMQGVEQAAGSLEGNDLCCDGEANVTISASQQCPVQMPEINVMKTYEEGIFKLHTGVLGEIHAPQLFTIADAIPDGITITGIDARSTDWNCDNSFPVVGPATLQCFYTGTMPVVTGAYDLYLNSTVDSAKLPLTNCMDAGVIKTDGTTVYTDEMMHHCVTIDSNENNETNTTDTHETNISCAQNEIMIEGVCEQLPEDPCPSGQQMVDEQCVEMPEINCRSNIVLVVDRSDSIRSAGGTNGVRNMINSFLDRFRGNGSQAAIVYFDTTASIVRPMSTINVGDVAPGYNPTIGGLTNWEDALEKARSIVSTGDIVFFITDGQPNRYLDTTGSVVPTGVPPALNTPALATLENLATSEAAIVANQIKAMGARIVTVGVGSIGSSASAIQHLNDIASTPSDININEFNELEGVANDYASTGCPDLLLTKKFIGGHGAGECRRVRIIEENQKGTFEIKVQNTTSAPLSGVSVRDVLPSRLSSPNNYVTSVGSASASGNTITWNVGALPANAVETLRFDVVLPAVTTNYEKIYNYAEVINATGVDVMPLLANPQTGPVNPNEHDESAGCVQIYEYTPPPPCDPQTDATHCLRVYKRKLSGEGNCMVGGECRYSISISNAANTAYTSTLNISDAMTPASATSGITITPSGSNSPDPLCVPSPTSIPFSCTQTDDIPANTTWYYNVVMSNTPDNTVNNCFTVNGVKSCFNFPSTKSMEVPVVKPEKADIALKKYAPKECKAGHKCTFKLRITNKGKANYKGPLSITDRSKEFVGKLVGTSPRGWKCKTTRKGYECFNPKVSLRSGESTTVKLTVRIPQRAKGYLNNCAKLDVPRGKMKIMAMQSMLLENGFDPNGIDGSMGKGTKKALKAYMESKHIKSQKSAIEKLVKSYPAVTSRNSCVKVKIKKSKLKCKTHEKIVGNTCKPRCKKWQNWNGKRCVACPKGTKWHKRTKECRRLECVKGLIMVKGKCVKKEKPKCIPYITHYSTLLGICVPNVSISIGGGGSSSSPKEHQGGDLGPAGY